MANGLLFDGVNDYVDIPTWSASGDFTVEFKFEHSSGSSTVTWAGTNDSGNFIASFSGTSLRLKIGGVTLTWNQTFTNATVYTIKFVRTGSTIEAFVDGSSLGTNTSSNTLTFVQIGMYNNQFHPAMTLHWFKLTGGTNDRFYDPANTSTGSTLPDTTSSQDGTLTNFPTDDSQWVDIGGGPATITGSGAHTATTATSSGSGAVGAVITGSGAHQATSATQSATGAREVSGSASSQADTATQTASGSVITTVTGAGSHQALVAVQTASGVVLTTITGSGSHQAQAATQSATGNTGTLITGSGSHQAAQPGDRDGVVTDVSLIAAANNGFNIVNVGVIPSE